MANFSVIEIRAANLLLDYGNPSKPIRINTCLEFITESDKTEITPILLITTSLFLQEYGFAELSELGANKMYKLTTWGFDYFRSGKQFEERLKELEEKEAEQLRKDERDEKTKDAQLQKLEAELLVLKDMQAEQRDFWKAQKAKNIQTTLIAIISALFSLVALMKTWGFL